MEMRAIDCNTANVRVVKRDDSKRYISGYAAVFYKEGKRETEYQLFTDLYERILPGAFTNAVKQDDVRALLNHDPNQLLARSGKTLTLKEDDKGLYYEFPVDENDPDHLRVVAKLERGDLSGSSFGFQPIERRFVENKDFDVVELVKVRLFDVSPATFPAYEGTSVGIRSTDGLDKLKEEYDVWKKAKQQDDFDERSIQQMKVSAGIL